MRTPLLVAATVFSLSALAQVPGYVPATGLVAWYPLNNSVADAGPNGLNGTASGTFAATDRFGVEGGASAFFGAYDQVPSNALFNTGTGMTVSAWVQLTDVSANQKIAGRVNGSFNSGFILGVEGGQVHPEVWNSTGTAHAFSAGTLLADQWTQVAITWASSGYLVVYVNGVAADSMAAGAEGIGTNSEPLIIGGSPWSQVPLYFPVNGNIDDFGIWNRALTPDEVMAVFNSGATGIEHQAAAADLAAYPVPAQDRVTLRTAPELAGRAFRIMDAMGRAVLQGQLGPGSTDVALTGLANGSYVVRLDDARQTALRFVKQ